MDCKTAGPTVKIADPLTTPDVALMVVVPGWKLVARPPPAMLAIPVADEVQVAELVKSCVVPLLKFPVVANCWLNPAATAAPAGVIVIEVNCTGTPMPDNFTFSGVWLESSSILRVPVNSPVAVGANVTEIIH